MALNGETVMIEQFLSNPTSLFFVKIERPAIKKSFVSKIIIHRLKKSIFAMCNNNKQMINGIYALVLLLFDAKL